MRIKKISVKNLRLYKNEEQSISLDTERNITVLLGNNGAGKTTLLYGISVLLSQFFNHFPGAETKKFLISDVRNETNNRKSDFLMVGLELAPTHCQTTEHMPLNLLDMDKNGNPKESMVVKMCLKGNNTTDTPNSILAAIKDYSLVVKSRLDSGEKTVLPIIAYYGTERGQIKPVQKRREFNDVFPRWYIYKDDALSSSTNFRRFFTWFERNEDLERRQKVDLWDKGYTSEVLNTVRRAIELFFEGKFINPRVEQNPLRFVVDDMTNPDCPMETRIDQMSDGYRISLALIADIASRMAEGNPSPESSGLENPLKANGIVMIDEIDLHLHPKLQREILRRLHNIFPNVQFIVSTHSPNVVIGALDLVQVVKLNNGNIDANINISDYEKYDVSLLLLSDLFDLDNVRRKQFKDLEEQEEKLLSKGSLTPDELAKLKQILKEMRSYGYSNGIEKRL